MCSSPNWCLSVFRNFEDYFGKHFLPISCSLGFTQMTKLALDKGIVPMGSKCSTNINMTAMSGQMAKMGLNENRYRMRLGGKWNANSLKVPVM